MDDPSVGPKIPQALEKILQLKESRQEEMNSQQGECHRVLRAARREPGAAEAESAFLHPFPEEGFREKLALGKEGLRGASNSAVALGQN